MGSIGGGALQAVGTKTQQVAEDVADLKMMTFLTGVTPTVMPTGTLLADPLILAQWRITKPAGFDTPTNYRYVTGYRTLSCQGRRTAGTGNFIVAVVTSTNNGTTWASPVTSFGFTSSTFSAQSDNDATQQNVSDLTDFAVILYASLADTSGEVRGISEMMSLVIPEGFELVRIV